MLQLNTVSGFATLTKLSVMVYLFTQASTVLAEDYFSPDLIETRGNIPRDIDISRFSKTDGQVPGIYHIDVYLNGNYIESRDISFLGKESELAPSLTYADFVKWGVKRNAQPDWMSMEDSATIDNIGA